MKPEKQETGALQKCELCEQKLNPHVKIYRTYTYLCPACYHQMEMLPELLETNVARFLIGNVV